MDMESKTALSAQYFLGVGKPSVTRMLLLAVSPKGAPMKAADQRTGKLK
jgi:hypothetical protein